MAHVQDTFPTVFLAADLESLFVLVFGSDDATRQATELAERLLRDGPAHVERVGVVTCSQSQMPRMLRGINEPVGEQPKIIGSDDRGVFLRCLPSGPHVHDWGGTYEPLNPRVHS